VAAVIDLYSRRVVGWSMKAEMTAQLVTDALVMGVWRRGNPPRSLTSIASPVALWDRRFAQAQAKALAGQLVKIERQVSQFLDGIVDTSVPSLIGAYDERIRKLEGEKLLIDEKMETAGHPATSFDLTLRTALDFLSNPWIF
jgi:Integrase core domain.